jgi:hypothetical protein
MVIDWYFAPVPRQRNPGYSLIRKPWIWQVSLEHCEAVNTTCRATRTASAVASLFESYTPVEALERRGAWSNLAGQAPRS